MYGMWGAWPMRVEHHPEPLGVPRMRPGEQGMDPGEEKALPTTQRLDGQGQAPVGQANPALVHRRVYSYDFLETEGRYASK